MNYLQGLWHSWLWALEMKHKVNQDMIIFGHIRPDSIKDIDKYIRDRGVIF
jgi:hypothetical protein